MTEFSGPIFCRINPIYPYLLREVTMLRRSCSVFAMFAGIYWFACSTASGQDKKDPEAVPIRENADRFIKAFNAAKADEISAMFLPKGEVIDEAGTVYQGKKEIADLLLAYFKKFPGTQVALNIESIRLVGPVAIEEGTRTMTTKDGAKQTRLRYIAVHVKGENGWQIGSIRDFNDDPASTPHEMLQSLAWLEGDWVNEGSDAVVKISYRWSDDKNFLLGDYHVAKGTTVIMKSSQRIGWDPVLRKVRSWIFDSDGGFGEGVWTAVGETWVIKSNAVTPDGSTGSATLTVAPVNKNRFTMKGSDRIIGDERADDFEVTVSKQPHAAPK